MRLLLDTHAFLYAIWRSDQLTGTVRALLADPAVERWVSTVSIWEIALKAQSGKLTIPIDRNYYLRHLQELRARTLTVELRHSLAIFELPMHHRDPFDRLLIAQAREEGLTLVTRDQEFAAYDVETVW